MKSSDRLKNLDRAHELYINNCEGCKRNTRASIAACKTCPFGIEMKNIGLELNKASQRKIKRILDKGQEMTRSDILFLLENEVLRKDIRIALGMYINEFNRLMENWELTKDYIKARAQMEEVS